MKRIYLGVIVVACAMFSRALFLRGQIPSQQEIRIRSGPYVPHQSGAIRVESNLVPINVVVRDSGGKSVTGLTKEDFRVFDAGKQQTISEFSVELHPRVEHAGAESANETEPVLAGAGASPQRRYIAFYFDDRNLPATDLTYVRNAAKSFVAEEMLPEDRIAVFTSSATVRLPFTAEKSELRATIDQVTSHVRELSTACPHIEQSQAWRIATYDNRSDDAFQLALTEAIQCNCSPRDGRCRTAQIEIVQSKSRRIVEQADEDVEATLTALNGVVRYFSELQGTKIVLVTSSGFFSMSERNQRLQDGIIGDALRAGVRINALDAKGLVAEWLGGSPAQRAMPLSGRLTASQNLLRSQQREESNDRMAILAQSSGGRFIHDTNDINEGVRVLAAVPEVSYSLAFSPESEKYDGAYHPLKVNLVNTHGDKLEYRPGYFAPSADSRALDARVDALENEVVSLHQANGFGIELSGVSRKLPTGDSAFEVTINVDVRTLPFKKQDGRQTEHLIFIVALFDHENHLVSAVQGVVDMALKDETLAALKASGGSATLTLQAPPGTYRLRQVAQELAEGRIACSDRVVAIQ